MEIILMVIMTVILLYIAFVITIMIISTDDWFIEIISDDLKYHQNDELNNLGNNLIKYFKLLGRSGVSIALFLRNLFDKAIIAIFYKAK